MRFKNLIFFLIFILLINVHVYSLTFSGVNSFDFEIQNNKLITPYNQKAYLFFQDKSDQYDIFLDYDSREKLNNGVKSIHVKFLDDLEYGFFKTEGNEYEKNRKKASIEYKNTDIQIGVGEYFGKRNIDIIPLNSKLFLYSLSKYSIVEGSERIFIDNILLKKNIDYFIDYPAGTITLYNIYTNLSRMKVYYSYNNDFMISPDSFYSFKYGKEKYCVEHNVDYDKLFFKQKNLSFNYYKDSETLNEYKILQSIFKIHKDVLKINIFDNDDFKSSIKEMEPYRFRFEKKKFIIEDYKNIDKVSYFFKKTDSDFNFLKWTDLGNINYISYNIRERYDKLFVSGWGTLTSDKDYSGDYGISYREKKVLFYTKGQYVDSSQTDLSHKINYFDNQNIFSLDYNNGNTFTGLKKTIGKIKIGYLYSDEANDIKEFNYNNGPIRFFYKDSDKYSTRFLIRFSEYYIDAVKEEDKKTTGRFSLSKNNIKISYSRDSLLNNIYYLKIQGEEDFYEINYNSDLKTGNFIYSIIIK